MRKFKIKIVSVGKRLNPENGQHLYGIRHSDDDWGKPITVEKNVFVNRYGYIISEQPLDKIVNGENKFYELNSEERQIIFSRENTGWFDVRELFEQYEVGDE